VNESIIRIGTVNFVDEVKRTARVAFADKPDISGKPLISAPLAILQSPPIISNLTVNAWLPKIGQTVLCIYLPNGGGDGVIIGGL
jgi:hypothetical protein